MGNYLFMAWHRFRLTRFYKKLSSASTKNAWLAALWLAILACTAYMSFGLFDTDVYYMLATGRHILLHGISHENPFISTPGQGIVVQNWLYCAVLAFVYSYLHSFGLWLFLLLSISAMAAVIFEFFDFRHSDNRAMIGIFAVIVIMFFGYVNLRPEIFTFVLIMLEIIGTEKYRDTGKVRYLWLLPLSTWLEINGHASYWILHYVVMLPYIVPVVFKKISRVTDSHIPNKMTGKMVPFLLLMTGVLFINPYGFDAVAYIFHSLGSGVLKLVGISEQQPYSLMDVHAFWYITMLFIFFCMWWHKKLASTDFYMFAGFAALFMTAAKWQPFFAVSSVFLFRAMYNYTKGHDGYRIANLKVPAVCSGLIIAMVCSVFIMLARRNDIMACFDIKTDDYMTYDAVKGTSFESFAPMADYLDENDPDAAVFALFEQSNYFEYRGYKVFSDARPELYVREIAGSDDISKIFLEITSGTDQLGYFQASCNAAADNSVKPAMSDYVLSASEYGSMIDGINCDYFVVNMTSAVMYYYFDTSPDKYECVVTDGVYKLYKRLF